MHGRFTRGRTATTPRVANTVLLPIAVVGMPRAEGVDDVAVILAALVGIANQQRNRRAGGGAFVDAGEYFHLIGLAPLRGMPAFAGGTTIEVGAKLLLADRQPRWTAVDNTADGGTMAFAEGGDGKQFAEGVTGHRKKSSGVVPHRLTRAGRQASVECHSLASIAKITSSTHSPCN